VTRKSLKGGGRGTLGSRIVEGKKWKLSEADWSRVKDLDKLQMTLRESCRFMVFAWPSLSIF
jgi:hypothetical protein